MFVHDSQLPQVLDAESYYTDRQHECERNRLFLPGWHFVASLADLRRDGDYLTIDLLGQPLLVWRSCGEIHVFLNVCAHRSSLLTNRPCGRMERLKCQYHGWEYDERGRTRRIPEAHNFRPLEQGELGLTKLRSETRGQLVFVTLDEQASDLASYLGPAYDLCGQLFSGERRRILKIDFEVAANWKLRVENALESYHIESVHPKSFGRLPSPESCTHQLEEWGSVFTTNEPAGGRMRRLFDELMARSLGLEADYKYEHFIFYPNVMFAAGGVFSVVEVAVPVTPTRSRVILEMFCHPGHRSNPLSALVFRALCWGGRRFAKQVL
ncbi:MAG: aromatic ring-hydroxylating dioxygenase subunit alpha, partial [Planctomycetota bacterium]